MPFIRKTRLRSFQYSLGTLFLLMLIAGIGMRWVAVRMHTARMEREAAEPIEKLGGDIRYDYQPEEGAYAIGPPPGPAWMRRLFGENFFAHVIKVGLVHVSRATDCDMEHLKDFRQLRILYLTDCPHITDDGLQNIQGSLQLKALSLSKTQVTDAGLGYLTQLKQLEALALNHTRITDAGLERLKDLKHLESLDLSDTLLTDAGLKHLAGLKQLKSLFLDGTRVTDSGLEHLKGLPELQELFLARTQVTDRGLEYLQAFTQVKFVWAPNTRVTEKGLKKFEQARIGG